MSDRYSIIDIETSGSFKKGHKITELAIINMDGSNVVEEFSTLINPERNIPLYISKLTGITNEMVCDAPKFFEVAKKIVEMTEGRIFVAHNVYFDFNFIKHEFADLGYSYSRDKLCTVKLARKNLPGYQSYSLGRICSDLGIKIKNRHRALGDALATVELFKLILSKDNKPGLEKTKLLIPPHINPKEIEDLPESCGVYYIYDQNGGLLYIGKSKNIKKRLMQHLRLNIKRPKDLKLKEAMASVSYRLFDSELLALLFEAHEIKENRPKFNTNLKRRRFNYSLKFELSSEGVAELKISSIINSQEDLYLFKSKKTAEQKLAKMYNEIYGPYTDLQGINPSRNLLLRTIGKEDHNKLVLKLYTHGFPKERDINLNISSRSSVVVENLYPVKIVHNDFSCDLKQDPDLRGILWGYLRKGKTYKSTTFD